MFHSKRDFGPSKIQLPKRTIAPGKDFLRHLYSQAIEFRGREVEVSWPDSTGTKIYGIVVKAGTQGDHTSWLIWQEDGLEKALIWQSNTNDTNLIADIVVKLESGAPLRAQSASQDMPIYTPPAHELRPDDPYGGIRGPGSSLKQTFTDPRVSSTSLAGQHAAVPGQSDLSGQPQPTSNRLDETGNNRIGQSTSASQSLELGQAFDQDTPATNAARMIANTIRTQSNSSVKDFRILSDLTMSGDLGQVATSVLLKAIASNKLSGKLELIGEESTGTIFFAEGQAGHATTHRNSGDVAIRELVSWPKCLFKFVINEFTPVHSVEHNLEQNIMEGNALLDQRKHLERAGLTYESFLVKKHQHLGEAEVRVFLTKGSKIDLDLQIKIYKAIGARCTLFDLLRDYPMEAFLWVPLLFNFITCELIEIKPPDSTQADLFDFLGDGKAAVDTLANSLLRPETGILSYPSFLYLLRHEFYRYERYGWPVTVVLFDIHKRSDQIENRYDLVGPREALVAIQRIELIKRPLDLICHFETTSYALLLPNTVASSGGYVANRIMQALLAAPLSTTLDKKHLLLAFGIASIPADADTIEQLLFSARDALNRARNGDFPIVVAHRQK